MKTEIHAQKHLLLKIKHQHFSHVRISHLAMRRFFPVSLPL